jgi:hypothetical protein
MIKVRLAFAERILMKAPSHVCKYQVFIKYLSAVNDNTSGKLIRVQAALNAIYGTR